MFAIYDLQGRRFRNPLEQLRKVRKIPAGRGMTARDDDAEYTLQNLARQATADQSASAGSIQAYREARRVPEREAIVHAYQIMSQPVETVPLGLDAFSALQRFRELRYQQLPVLDEGHRLVGMLFERDLLEFMIIDGVGLADPHGKSIADAMSTEVITADPVTDVRRIAAVMGDYRLSALPIVNERDALIGVVSRSDILRAITNDPPLSLWT